MFAPAKNLAIATKEYSIYLKLAPVKIRKARVIMNIIEDFKFFEPCVSKFFIMIDLSFLSLGLSQRNRLSN